jgi:RNA polymerase sigma-70 factor (ECF subfamily)
MNARETSRPLTAEEYGRQYDLNFVMTVRFLVSRGCQYDEATEVAQSAWVAGWERRSQLRNTKVVVAWVNSIAANLVRSSHRHPRRSEGAFLEPLAYAAHSWNPRCLDAALLVSMLPPEDRFLLEQHYIYGLSSAELAKRLGCSPGAARVRLLRARRSVRQWLDSDNNMQADLKPRL